MTAPKRLGFCFAVLQESPMVAPTPEGSVLVRMIGSLRTQAADKIGFIAESAVRDVVRDSDRHYEYIVLFGCRAVLLSDCNAVLESAENVMERKLVPSNRVLNPEQFPLQEGAALF